MADARGVPGLLRAADFSVEARYADAAYRAMEFVFRWRDGRPSRASAQWRGGPPGTR